MTHSSKGFGLSLALLLGSMSLGRAMIVPLPAVAQSLDENTVTGELTADSDVTEGDRYFNRHTFEGIEGDHILIDLMSEDTNAYLILVGPDGEAIANDSDSGEKWDARIAVTLPVTGTYEIWASTFWPEQTGPYTITWQPATPDDVAENEVLRQADDLMQQAYLLYNDAQYAETIPLLEEATAIRREQLGDRHPDLVTNYLYLGLLNFLVGHYDDVEVALQQYLLLHQENQLEVASALNDLALVYELQEQWVKAEQAFAESLAILRQLQIEQPDIAHSADLVGGLNRLADLMDKQGAVEETVHIYQSAIELVEALEDQHTPLAISYNNLGLLYAAQGQYDEAETYYQQAIQVARNLPEPDLPNLATSLSNLAQVFRQQGNFAAAESLFLESLDIRQDYFGEQHLSVAISLSGLGNLYGEQGRYEEAAHLLGQALEIERSELGDRHPEVAISLNNWAAVIEDLDRYDEAEQAYLEAISINREHFGDQHPKVTTNLNNLALLYSDQGRYEEAEEHHLQAIAIETELFGEEHPALAIDLNNLAILYKDQGRYAEAEALYARALSINREHLGDRHPDVATILSNLGGLYENKGHYSESENLLLEAISIFEENFGKVHPEISTTLSKLGITYHSQGRYGLSESTFQRALEINQQVFEEGNLSTASILNNLATLYSEQARYNDAARIFQEVVSIYREKLRDNHPDIASTLSNLAEVYLQQGNYSEAENIHLEALGIRRMVWGENHPDVALSLHNLAGAMHEQGRYQEARSLYLQSLNINREQLGEQHLSVATTLGNLATVYDDLGRYGEAEELYLEALEIKQVTLDERHPSVAITLNNLASSYNEQGLYSEAEATNLEALSIRREYYGDRHPDVANSLNSLAELYEDLGRYDESESSYLEALNIFREAVGENHPSYTVSLHNLASLYHSQGDLSKSEPLFLQVLEVERSQLGDNHPRVATTLNNLAVLLYAQGRFNEAEGYIAEALEIQKDNFGDFHPLIAISLTNLALVYSAQGYHSESETLYQEALEINRSIFGDEHLEVANILSNLALFKERQGDTSEVESLLIEALEVRTRILGENHSDVALSLNNLGAFYANRGLYAEAEELYLQALAIWQQLSASHPKLAENHANLAVLYYGNNQLEQAIEQVQASLEIEEIHLNLNLATLADDQRQQYVDNLGESLDVNLSLHLQTATDLPEATELALTTILRRKGRVLEAGIDSFAALRQNLDSEEVDLLDRLINQQQQIAALTINAPNSQISDAYLTVLTELEDEATQLEAELARRSAAFQAEFQPPDIATVQAQIPTDSALLEYVRYQPFNPTAPRLERFGEDRYAVYVLTSGGDITAVDLGEAVVIDNATQSLLSSLEDANQSIRAVQQQADALYSLILAPIRTALSDQEHLLIAPDSVLNLLPFEVLFTPQERYLVEDFQVTYLTSGRDLLKLGLNNSNENAPVIFAAPDYGETATTIVSNGTRSVDMRSLQVEPLAFAAREGRTLSQLLPDSVLFTGSAATEHTLKQVEAPRILHIATHGLFLPDAARETEFSEDTYEVYEVPSENPLIRSMLALEGFNRRSSGREDGVFTALEASYLNLYGTQLVTLSACETGQGEVVSSEGIYGLRRAFAIAGAESLLMSLWRVDDEGTTALMEHYYQNLLSGMGRSEALRQVQLETLNADGQERHPFDWAAFVLAGDWRSLESR